ncbi:MAG: hypothetical protein ACO1TE_02480 [Prosthecobacter sp.]
MNRILSCLLLLTVFLRADEFDPADNTIVLGQRVGLIKPGMKAADLERAYGKKNLKLTELPGPEGSTYPGAKLFEGTDRELEIAWDEEKKVVADINVVGKAWKFENGLKLGMSLEEVEKINGKPFLVNGFGWDYGGYANFEGGKLEAKVGIRFDTTAEKVSESLSGDKQIPSTDKKLRAAKPVIDGPISVFMR